MLMSFKYSQVLEYKVSHNSLWILVDYKNKMVKDTTMKLFLFERAYSQVFIMYACMYIIPRLQAH